LLTCLKARATVDGAAAANPSLPCLTRRVPPDVYEAENAYLEAREQRQVLRLEAHIARCQLLVVDELGYLPLDKLGAEHLFGFFSQCYERTSLIVTTNLPFAEWPQIFAGDERLAGALIDRLTHRVHVVEIQGDSYRLQASLKAKKGGGVPKTPPT
jgi:DNA replication protein DnaC